MTSGRCTLTSCHQGSVSLVSQDSILTEVGIFWGFFCSNALLSTVLSNFSLPQQIQCGSTAPRSMLLRCNQHIRIAKVVTWPWGAKAQQKHQSWVTQSLRETASQKRPSQGQRMGSKRAGNSPESLGIWEREREILIENNSDCFLHTIWMQRVSMDAYSETNKYSFNASLTFFSETSNRALFLCNQSLTLNQSNSIYLIFLSALYGLVHSCSDTNIRVKHLSLEIIVCLKKGVT